ncbi:MAG: CocE/NonD family hydrolase, partial [Prochlorococcaceae cyanobacterium]
MVCRDGTRLATRLWRPATSPPWPVLLMRQPYGRAIASSVTYAHPSWYARHGFMVAVQDVRGRGDSEGQFGGFAQEASDGADAVRWARRLSGSNGRVGSYGFSYQGLTQLLNDGGETGDHSGNHTGDHTGDLDVADPESLPDCLAPAMCGLDERLHWASSGGCHWWALGLAWGLQLAAEGCRRRGDRQAWLAIRACLSSGRSAEEGLALLRRHDGSSMVLAWLEADASEPGGGAQAAWGQHKPPAALLARPMLLVAGWWDPHLEGSLDLWSRIRLAGGKPALRVGPWTHLNWQGGIDRLQL